MIGAVIVSTSAAAIALSSAAVNFWNLFVTTTSATGVVSIVGINLAVLGLVGTAVIYSVVEGIKKMKPNWETIAWIPVALGIILFVLTGVATGQISTAAGLAMYIISGIASGSIASWIKNIWQGK